MRRAVLGLGSHWSISVDDEVREDKIEIKSVFEQIIPAVSLLALLLVEGQGGGSSEARLFPLGIGARLVPTKSENLLALV